MKNTVTIGVVILNYSTYHETIRLVSELQNQSIVEQLRIVIVDNCSPNESYESLMPLVEKYKNVTILQTGENLGYAKGNNFGLKYLEENISPDYVAILNNDVILPHDCFERLVERYQVLENPGVIAPTMTDPNGQISKLKLLKVNRYRDDLLSMFALYRFFKRGKKQTFIDNSGLNATKVEVVPGSFMFVDFNIFKSMGHFYPNTFLYTEERFIAAAAKKINKQNYVLLDQSYIHNHSKTINIYHNLVSKNKMLYDGYIKFAREYRSNGKFKAFLMQIAMTWSLIEWRIIEVFKNRAN